MRPAAIFAVLLAAAGSPALAQAFHPLPPQTPIQPQYNELWAQQEMARQQSIALQNQLTAIEAQQRTDEAIANVQAQRINPRLPLPDVTEGAPPPSIDTGALASIPDSALAESNKRVLDAAQNRR
ncbi:MAG TPA: hypothetical protein VLI41_13100 [Phenylobacterium sp.]|uniref:hypothetical protein n=1 Tax=Phenylobacterium sp. TaxID=1871053 RepID=UPI002BE6B6D1|nr:hypothetical protein [Phenylobacterium sp.]HSV04132.1 hypothetical protein [Phenylobacterium sp.]